MNEFISYRPTVIEKRSAEGTNAITLAGIVCPYGQWSESLGQWGEFKEQFLPGAFGDINRRDVICTVNHDMDRLLGRRSAGTLKLTDTPTGLLAECSMPNTGYARDLCELVTRGDVKGMSFGFKAGEVEWGMEQRTKTRTIKTAEIFEVCFTPDPAYLTTSVTLQTRCRVTAPDVVVPTLLLDDMEKKLHRLK